MSSVVNYDIWRSPFWIVLDYSINCQRIEQQAALVNTLWPLEVDVEFPSTANKNLSDWKLGQVRRMHHRIVDQSHMQTLQAAVHQCR